MASHSRSPRRRGRAVGGLVRVGLVLSAAGAALTAGGAPAEAAASGDGGPAGNVVRGGYKILSTALHNSLSPTAEGSIGPVKRLPLDPLAGTGVDPLDNSVGTQVADFKPVGTNLLTDPLTRGGSLDDLPLAGEAIRRLPG
ncbi:hypothetical protein [Streptomyces sp. NPDC003077]|uniref:hypothetical protein n=1 Tax=Streptomyces sp. NPDC003077 TaxID=3154443 RepID=UPI0033A487FC